MRSTEEDGLGRSFAAFLSVALVVWACGDSGPAGPTTTATLPLASSDIPAGTVLSVVSGETGAPVPNARVVVAERTLVTDGSGQVALPESLARGILLDILEPGFLDRQTRLRDAASVRFPLWPRTSPTGLDANFTFNIVYGASERSRRMMRLPPGTTEAYVVPSPRIRKDDAAMEQIRRAADMITEITRGEIEFIVADDAPTNAIVFELTIDPGDPAITDAVAVAKRELRNWTVIGGTVVYVTMGTVRTSTTVHELGHMFGLAHSTSRNDVMFAGRSNRTERFSDREGLVMRLMLKRPAGNQMPDNDRNTAAFSQRGQTWLSVIVCQ